jgi:hypothetical protein
MQQFRTVMQEAGQEGGADGDLQVLKTPLSKMTRSSARDRDAEKKEERAMIMFVSSNEYYVEMLEQVFECLYSYCLTEFECIDITGYLVFEDVYVKPNVVFNFLFDLGFSVFELDKWHSRVRFFECYAKSSVGKYLSRPSNENQYDK